MRLPGYMDHIRLHSLSEQLQGKLDELAVMHERLEELKITTAGRPGYLEKLIYLTTATARKNEAVAQLAQEIQVLKSDERAIHWVGQV